jgi:hypothetical protein
MQYWQSSLGQSSAQSQAISKEVLRMSNKLAANGHNYRPFVTCEGLCSTHGVAFTTHRMLSEVYIPAEEAYEQTYGCITCKHTRRFGLTVERQTLMGEGN